MLAIGENLGPYKIIAPIGAGGMGEVYRAHDERLGRDVAIKLLPERVTNNPSAIDRFTREARAASALNHPNIITIYEVGAGDAGRFIAMELVHGQTLRAMMGKPIDLNLLASIFGQTAKALAVAHRAGIIHRDIKPENIMVRDDGYVKVLDFGLARLDAANDAESIAETLAQKTEIHALTEPGVIVGTIKYMSPEQSRGDTLSGATDVFSLGTVLYEAATGQYPFSAGTQVGVLQAIAIEQPAAPSRLNPEISPELDSLILQMLEKDARRRPAASDVDKSLAAIAINSSSASISIARMKPPSRHSVGRENERALINAAFDSVSAGCGLVLAVTGELGIGKTTFVEDFIAELEANGKPYIIARGRCSERLAGAEAYLPLLEALDNSLHGEGSQWAARAMKQIAPTWYAQVSTLSLESSLAERVSGEQVSQERMKRELGALLQEVSRLRPLILFIDDLHWADVSTIGMLAYLASKFETMRVLIIVTYRPSDLLLAKHPFLQIKPEMIAHGTCREIQLEFLSREEIERYLALEFPNNDFPPELPALIHARTEGNPLFMSDLVRYLRDRKVIVENDGRWQLAESITAIQQDMPESVRGMIQRKIDHLSEDDRKLLVAASVQGYDFDSAVIARALALDPADVEERLEAMERIHALVRFVAEDEFPDRTLTLRYRFVHALYQNALYASLRPTRKASLSAAVAEALLIYHKDQSHKVAPELASLFEAARDFSRAVDFYLVAAQSAAHVFAQAETEVLARRGLNLLGLLPASDERDRKELALQLALGYALSFTKGYATPESGESRARARELCQKMGDTPQLAPALYGLWVYYLVAGNLSTAREMAEQLLRLAESAKEPGLLMAGHYTLGSVLMFLGEIVAGFEHLERALTFYDPKEHRAYISLYRTDPSIDCMCQTVRTLWLLGYQDRALKRIDEAMRLAEQSRDPHSGAFARLYKAGIYKWMGDVEQAKEWTARCIEFCNQRDIVQEKLWATPVMGWALAKQGQGDEGIALIQRCLAVIRAIHAEISLPHLISMLVEALEANNRFEEGLAALDEAFEVMDRTNERWSEAELLILKGRLLLAAQDRNRDTSEAEESFHRAIETARSQSAKVFELRATAHLSRLHQQQGRRDEARSMLAEIYNWFAEGFDAPDLKEARALLDNLKDEE